MNCQEPLFLPSEKFYCSQYCTYPPFKNGYYLEEYFMDYMHKHGKIHDKNGRIYIPAFWTAMQIESWFPHEKPSLQQLLDKFLLDNANPNGFFTIVQHDDGVMFDLPSNVLVYGACTGDIKIPLIYQDSTNTLEKQSRLSYKEKPILCSFVGSITHPIRQQCYDILHDKPGFEFTMNHSWTNAVDQGSQGNFIEITKKSKFALAPRG